MGEEGKSKEERHQGRGANDEEEAVDKWRERILFIMAS